MFAIIANICLFGGLLIRQLCKYKSLTASCVLISLYVLIAVGGVVFIDNKEIISNLSVLFSFYFFFVVYLFFIPVLNTNAFNYRIKFNDNKVLKLILYTYVIMAIISSMGYLGYIIKVFSTGDWVNIKANAYNAEMDLPNGIVSILSRIVVSVLSYAVLIYGFWCLTNENKKFREALFWIIISIFPTLIADLASAYRGGILISILMVLYLYVLFRKDMIERNKAYIKIFGVCLLAFLSILILAISISRFESDFIESLLSYFGQSFINYDYGIASRIHSISGGKFFLGNLINLDMDQIMIDSLYGMKTNNGQDLNTFVGIMIFDYGFIMTVIIALILSRTFYRMFRRKRLDLATMYIYVFYVHFLFNGAFHFPWNYAQKCLYAFLIYIMLKVSNKLVFKFNSQV